jgi:hypothetical protein
MSWFSNFLTDIAGPIGKATEAGMINQENRNRDLESMRKQIPIMVEQQKALLPGQIERDTATRQAAWENAFRQILVKHKLDMERDAAKRTPGMGGDLLGFLKSKVEAPQDPSVMPIAPRAPGYGIGEEASSGLVPKTRTRPAPDVFMEAIGLDPKEREAVPSMTAKGEWGLSFQKRSNPPGVSGSRDAIGEYSRERRAAEKEADDLGLIGSDWANHVTKRMAKYREAQAKATGSGSALGGNTGPAADAKVATAGRMGEERAAGGIRGELRPVDSPSAPGVKVSGAAAVGEERERGKIPTQVEKKTAELERTYSLIDQIDTLSKPLITAKNWQEVLPQYVKLKVGSFTNANQVAALYESTLNEFLGQLAREVSQERGVLTNQDVDRIKAGMPSFGNTAGVRSGKITILKNIIRMNQEAEGARTRSGGRIPESARAEFRKNIDTMLADLASGGGSSSQGTPAPSTTGGWSIKPKGR